MNKEDIKDEELEVEVSEEETKQADSDAGVGDGATLKRLRQQRWRGIGRQEAVKVPKAE